NGSWIAPSAAPGGLHNSHWRAIYGGDGFWTLPDPLDPNIAYAEYQGGNIARIDLATLKSVNIKPQQSAQDEKLRWNWNTPIHTGSNNKSNLYIGSQYLFKSNDKGNNWTRISPDLTTNDKRKQDQENSGGLSVDNTSAENHCTIFAIAESPMDENLIWIGTDDGNLQYTADGGKTWINVSKNYNSAGIPAGTWVSSIEPGRFNKDVVYVTFDNHMYGDHKTYAAVSTDRGKTWKAYSSTEFTGFAHKIKEDLVNKELLFLGTEMGLFATIDGGDNWFRMKNRVPDYALVRDIQIHPITHDLILGTHGRGVIVIDDITPMRQLTAGIIEKDVHLFPLKNVAINMGRFGDGGFPYTGGWNAGNPPSIPPIQYYFKDRLNTGDVKVDILDEAGNLIQTMPGTKRKGINKVFWNLKMTPPKVASGGNKIDFAGFTAPMVLPGTYTVKLTVADKEYKEKIQLVHDEKNKNFSVEDRQVQYKTAMELYRMHEDLTKLVETISGKQDVAKKSIDKQKDAKSKKILSDFHDQLEKLRGTLLAIKKQSMFADEVQLRERITEVYGAVTNQEARPSNLQIQRVEVLKQELAKAKQAYADISKKYEVPVARVLEKTDTAEIKTL
ncbi:MAG: hypothetical protein H0V91_05900, partial [Flavisolibacter sp.]|nr:hypothetical protein [Flavisolibacter sp.]